MKKLSIKSFLITILIFNYLLNILITKSYFNYFFEIPKSIRFISLLFFVMIFYLIRYCFNNYKFSRSIDLFVVIFLLFAVFNLKDIDPNIFWETVPDSRTYLKLGQNLFECFKLTMSCEAGSHLEFAIGQPIFSGILSKYFYNYSYIVNCLMIGYVIYTISNITHKKYKVTSGVGLFYLLSHSLIFELTPMMISEITFTFMLFLILKFYFSKSKNKFNFLPAIYAFSILIRPVGIALLPIFTFIFKRKKYTLFIFVLVLIFAAGFNFVTAGEFTISDFNVDSRQDGLFENSGYVDYFYELIFSDNNTKYEFIDFTSENYYRLYGKSSKDCDFIETCFFYNPKYNQDGTVPDFFANSTIGNIFERYLVFFFNIRAPQGIGLMILPLTVLLPFLSKRFKFERILSLSIVLLIIPSLITAEFGNRWNFTILFISSLIIEMTTSSIIYKQNK